MELPPPHVLAQLDAIIVGQARESDANYQNVGDEDDGDTTVAYDPGDETVDYEGDGAAELPTTISRFWGVTWDRQNKKWWAYYKDATGKTRSVGYFDDEEEAARARDQAVRDAGLEAKRRMNAVDAAGALKLEVPALVRRPSPEEVAASVLLFAREGRVGGSPRPPAVGDP